ncbi:hypothetical protein [Fibrella aquatica]|uniref:hypothetical protein n=1 Tax=Fibrella aquatica TaxID=3242487 RepID=UPI0035230C37
MLITNQSVDVPASGGYVFFVVRGLKGFKTIDADSLVEAEQIRFNPKIGVNRLESL